MVFMASTLVDAITFSLVNCCSSWSFGLCFIVFTTFSRCSHIIRSRRFVSICVDPPSSVVRTRFVSILFVVCLLQLSICGLFFNSCVCFVLLPCSWLLDLCLMVVSLFLVGFSDILIFCKLSQVVSDCLFCVFHLAACVFLYVI
uniref:Uncharacterized protein n=1 Tax=Kalanchoe fedtschenkoi TaxID=63787 RepID=A0A7N0V458_KALFE